MSLYETYRSGRSKWAELVFTACSTRSLSVLDLEVCVLSTNSATFYFQMELHNKLCQIKTALKQIREEANRLRREEGNESDYDPDLDDSEHYPEHHARTHTQIMGNQLTRTIYNEPPAPGPLVYMDEERISDVDQRQLRGPNDSDKEALIEAKKEIEKLIAINSELERTLSMVMSEKISLFLKIGEYKKCLQKCTCKNLF